MAYSVTYTPKAGYGIKTLTYTPKAGYGIKTLTYTPKAGYGPFSLTLLLESPLHVISMEVGTVDASTLVVVFSKAVTAVGSNYLTGWTFKVNTVTRTATSATRQTNKTIVYFALSSPVVQGATVTADYAV